MPIYRLSVPLLFPPAEEAEDGLLAVGGDLSVPRLLAAYRQGIFPWYNEDQPILWWSPDPRMVLEPGQIHITRSLRKVLRREVFEVRMDTAFSDVIRHCAELREADGTWLLPEMQAAYLKLHRLGLAHSVETTLEGALVGGLYGIYLGRVFYGESMFSLRPDASKVALVALCRFLQARGVSLIDCQLSSEHLARMGAREVPRSVFLQRMRLALAAPTDASPWVWDGSLPLLDAPER